MEVAAGRAPTPDVSPSPPDLSVIVAGGGSVRSVARALAALDRACAGIAAEILLMDVSGAGPEATRAHPAVRVHPHPAGTATPILWSRGVTAATGRVVAFTTTDFVVAESWARSLLGAITAGATGVAGIIVPARSARAVSRATFFLRYSAFLAPSTGDQGAHEIPGDNAAYRRDALLRHAASFRDGFWEVDFHRRLRAEAGSVMLVLVPGAEAEFDTTMSLRSIARRRFEHGTHSGAWRVETGVRATWQVVAAAPLVPLVLVGRVARRVLRARRHRASLVLALPALVVLATAWAAGEVWGALRRRSLIHAGQPQLAA